MTSERQLRERLERDLERLLAWSRTAESRLSLVLPLATTMLGALAVLAPSAKKWPTVAAICTAVAALLLILSIGFATAASFPRTDGPKGSVLYFGGIADKDEGQYGEAVRTQSSEEYVSDLVAQCHRNAVIAKAKYVWVQRSMGALVASALPWALGLFLLYYEKA